MLHGSIVSEAVADMFRFVNVFVFAFGFVCVFVCVCVCLLFVRM